MVVSSLSISLDRLSLGSNTLRADQIYAPHKENIERCLSKIFHERCSPTSDASSLKLKLQLDKPVFEYNGKTIPLEKCTELKRIQRIIRYYQHTGELPKEKMDLSLEAEMHSESKTSIQAVHDASIPGTNGQLLAGMRIADDTLSLTRHMLVALTDISPKDPIISRLGYYAGSLWTFFGLRELDNGLTEFKRSKVIGDDEGLRRSEARILSGGIISSASIGYLMGEVCHSYLSETASNAFLGVSNVLFGVGSCLAMGMSLLGAIRCDRFNQRLNEYHNNPNLSEKERLKAALKFLKECISVTQEERNALIQEIEKKHPDWPEEKKVSLLNQKLKDLTETKVKYMKRRTSTRSLQLVLNHADDILKKLEDPKTLVEGITRATDLINTIQKESRVKQSLYTLGFVAALVSFIAMLMVTFSTLGVVPFMLYGISGTIYLLITIYTVVGMVFKKDPKKEKIEVDSMDEMLPLHQ